MLLRAGAVRGVAPSRQGPRPQRSTLVCRAEPSPLFTDISKYANKEILDKAAKRYSLGLDQGFDEDEMLALELGVRSLSAVPDTQRPYLDKIKEKLAKRASELKAEEAEMKARLARNLELGKRAYECGEYPASVRLLEQAVIDTGADSVLGGEAQLWLGLSYQACGREADAIELYKEIEANHPSRKVKKQAGELRFILEAPKLEIGEDERVKIPLLQSDTWRSKARSSYTPRNIPRAPKAVRKDSYWDRVSLDAPDPLAALPDKWYVRVAAVCILVGVTIYGNYLYRG